MKRIVALVTLIALMLCNGSLAYAVDSGHTSTDEYGDNFVTQEEIEEGRAEGERLYKVGMGIRSGSRARASLDVRLQLQDDKAWVDKHMPCSAEDTPTNPHKRKCGVRNDLIRNGSVLLWQIYDIYSCTSSN